MRFYTELNSELTRKQLSQLADRGTSVEAYRDAMMGLGNALAKKLASKLVSNIKTGKILSKPVCIACTVEDADFLAKGIIEGLEQCGLEEDHIRLACFWNERLNPFDIDDASLNIAPILKKYTEPVDLNNSILVVVKSIISGACVVKTNLSSLIEHSKPKRIFVVAPVMFKGADDRLAMEFQKEISSRFEYLTFAIDDQKSEDGKEAFPGVGGSVYVRLGFGGAKEKNQYVPEIVKVRRRMLSADYGLIAAC